MNIAMIRGFTGILAAFWYISWIVAAVLILSGLVAFIIYGTMLDLEEKEKWKSKRMKKQLAACLLFYNGFVKNIIT